MKYYITNNGQQAGPFELHELLAHGLNANSYVWNESMPNWQPAMQVPEVAALLQPGYAPQQPGYAPSDYEATIPDPNKEVGFVDALKICFSKYVDFSGRARRSEYWWFMLWYVILLLPTCCLSSFVFLIPSAAVTVRRLHDTGRSGWWWGVGVIMWCVNQIVSMISKLSTGFDFFYYTHPYSLVKLNLALLAISFIYLIYQIVLIVFCVQDSAPGENEYGPNPKY